MKQKVFSLLSLKVFGKQLVNSVLASLVFLPMYFALRFQKYIIAGIIGLIALPFYIYLDGWFGTTFWKWR